MNPYSEQELRMMFKSEDRVTITIVGYEDMSFDETFDNFEEQDVAGNPTHKLYLTAIEQLRQAATHPNIHISPILKYLL